MTFRYVCLKIAYLETSVELIIIEEVNNFQILTPDANMRLQSSIRQCMATSQVFKLY